MNNDIAGNVLTDSAGNGFSSRELQGQLFFFLHKKMAEPTYEDLARIQMQGKAAGDSYKVMEYLGQKPLQGSRGFEIDEWTIVKVDSKRHWDWCICVSAVSKKNNIPCYLVQFPFGEKTHPMNLKEGEVKKILTAPVRGNSQIRFLLEFFSP